MTALFSAPKPPPLPPPPPPLPERENPEIAESKRRARLAEKQRRGRAAAVLTGELTDEAPVSRAAGASLLGE